MQKPISVCNNTNNQQDSYLKNLYLGVNKNANGGIHACC